MQHADPSDVTVKEENEADVNEASDLQDELDHNTDADDFEDMNTVSISQYFTCSCISICSVAS